MEAWLKRDECTGCGACVNSCTAGALYYGTDEKGFPVPLVHADLCRRCGACRMACPVDKAKTGLRPQPENTKTPAVYEAWSLNEDVRRDSSSGGVFTEVARVILARGGLVAGAVMDENGRVRHMLAGTEEELAPMRQSKYVQSEMGMVYRRTAELLKAGKPVLFTGTPCQVAGLYGVLGGERPAGLYTMDFACHGVNAPAALQAWLTSLEKRHGSRAVSIRFRDKRTGWQNASVVVAFLDGSEYAAPRTQDAFMRGFLEKGLFLRPACTECRFKGFPLTADLTVGDFWRKDGIYQSDEGISFMMMNNEKANELLQAAKERLATKTASLEEAVPANAGLTESFANGKYSEYFYGRLKEGADYHTIFEEISLMQLQEDMAWLEKRDASRTEYIQKLTDKIAWLEKKENVHKADIQKQRDKIAWLEKKENVHKESIRKQQDKIAWLEKKENVHKADIQKQRDKIAWLEKKEGVHKESIRKQQDKIAWLEKKEGVHKESIRKQQDKIAWLEKKENVHKADIQKQQDKIAWLEKKEGVHKESLQKQQDKIAWLEKKEGVHKESLQKQQDKIAWLEKKENVRKADIQKQQDKIAWLEKKENVRKADIQKQQDKIAWLEKKESVHKEQIAKLQDQVAWLQKKEAARLQAINKLEEEIALINAIDEEKTQTIIQRDQMIEEMESHLLPESWENMSDSKFGKSLHGIFLSYWQLIGNRLSKKKEEE